MARATRMANIVLGSCLMDKNKYRNYTRIEYHTHSRNIHQPSLKQCKANHPFLVINAPISQLKFSQSFYQKQKTEDDREERGCKCLSALKQATETTYTKNIKEVFHFEHGVSRRSRSRFSLNHNSHACQQYKFNPTCFQKHGWYVDNR